MPNARNVLVLGTDPATRSLFGEWFDEEGFQIVDHSSPDADAPLRRDDEYDTYYGTYVG